MNITEIVRPVSTTTVPKVIYNLLQKHEFSTINENSDDRQQILVDDFSRREEIDSNLFKVPLTLESKKYLVKDVLPRISWVAENEKIQKILDNFQNKMNSKVSLEEAAQRRISHPEDMVLYGSEGINSVLQIMSNTIKNPKNISIKIDGSPSLIFGRDPKDGKLVITDKSGFNSKKYNGLTKSPKDLFNMLYIRNMEQDGRKEFSQQMAELWPLFEQAIPKNLKGYYQGDLLYSKPPQENENSYIFQPNKIVYKVIKKSELGQKISRSKACIVVHGFYKDKESNVIPTQNVDSLQGNPNLLVLNTSFSGNQKVFNSNIPNIKNIQDIDSFLNPSILKGLKISNLPNLIKSYMAWMAKMGKSNYTNSPQDFINWITNGNLTENKKSNIRNYIKENIEGYNSLWNAITDIVKYKNQIKQQLDKNIKNNGLEAYLNGKPSNEGYVLNGSIGQIKLVDRHIFMKDK